MKRFRTQSHVFLIFGLISLLILVDLGISLWGNRFTSKPIQRMVDEFYEIEGFINAFDECEKNVTAYRWLEEAVYTPELEGSIQDSLEEMEVYLDTMVRRMTVENISQYHDVRALKHMFPHYVNYIEDYLEQMRCNEKSAALSVYFQRETLVVLIRDYASQMLRDTVQGSQEEYETAQRITGILWYVQVLVGMMAIGLSAFFAIKLYEIILPIRRLIEASEEMENENFDIPDVPIDMKNEDLRHLTVTFNRMKHSTGRLIETLKEHNRTQELLRQKEAQVLESQRLAEQAKLLSLRTQVKPHFLFNTLNTIRRIAQLEKASQTEELILSLSRIFRHSLRNGNSLTTLADEIYVTQQYFKIQKVRFGDRISLEWILAESCEPEEILVPPFMLETLVENAVKHGLEPRAEGGRIWIKIQMHHETLQLIVSDNGCGMKKEILECIQNGEKPPGAENGIGLNNVANRLRLLNEKNRMTIYSTEGQGTRVEIEMSVQYREEEKLR